MMGHTKLTAEPKQYLFKVETIDAEQDTHTRWIYAVGGQTAIDKLRSFLPQSEKIVKAVSQSPEAI
jgi:hypothetical protein